MYDQLESIADVPPRIEHMHLFEDHAALRDNVLKRTVFVYYMEGFSRDLCEGSDRVHTRNSETLQHRGRA